MKIFSLRKKDIKFVSKLLSIEAASHVSEPGYYTLVALDEKDLLTPAGILQFYVGKSRENEISGKVTYIFVTPEKRDGEVARELAYELMIILRGAGIHVFEIHIPELEGTDAIKYVFSSCGFLFDEEDEYPYYEMTVGELATYSALSGEVKEKVKPFAGIQDYELNHIMGEFKRGNKSDVFPEGVSLDSKFWDRDVSCYYEGEDGSGVFLIYGSPEGVLEPRYFSAFGKDTDRGLLKLIMFASDRVKKKYPPEEKIMIYGKKEATNGLMPLLCPGAAPKTMLRGKIGVL